MKVPKFEVYVGYFAPHIHLKFSFFPILAE